MTPDTSVLIDRARGILRNVFGYPDFRGQQADVVTHVAAGNCAFVLMPTGGGKSLCYQVPALLRGGVTVVVSPLIALMQDQVAALARRGVNSALLNSTLDRQETARIERAVQHGNITLLYVSPERLVTERCLKLLAASPVTLFAIDEAHCIAEWGHDFRPDYLALSCLHERFSRVPRIALTATADAQTQSEIAQRLGLQRARLFRSSFDRPNITYEVCDKRDAHSQLLAFIRRHHAGAAGIVYRQSRNGVEETAAFLDAQDIPALPYHAGLSARVREENQAWFLKERGVVMVATIAFGMGIDKGDVRFVAHIDLPASIEGYYQETGRAGRDGLPSDAWLAFDANDAIPLRHRIAQSKATPLRHRVQLAKLDAMLSLCETSECRRAWVLRYFGESSAACGRCDNCVRTPPEYDATMAVRSLIACIYRTGARADVVYVIDVLRGAESVASLARVHAGVFGAGRDRSVDEWRAIVRQCVAMGIVAKDLDRGVLVRTEQSAAVMRGERRVLLRVWRTRAARSKTKRRRAAWDGAPSSVALLDRLHEWRAARARRHCVPQHTIMHDAALMELVIRRPQTAWALRTVAGVGRVRARIYGDELLALLAATPERE